jgi:hypothetical protein
MLRLISSTGDSVTVELPDDLDIDAETAKKLENGEIEIEADDLIRIMRA